MANLDPVTLQLKADIGDLKSTLSEARTFSDQTFNQIERSSDKAGEGLKRTGGASRVFGQQFSQMGQQVAAGTSLVQAFAIQLPDLVVGMQAAGVEAKGLAGFFMGPWGVALTTAAAVALSFAGDVLKIGDAADDTSNALDRMIKKYRQAQAEKNRFTAAQTDIDKTVAQRDLLQRQLDLARRNSGNPNAFANDGRVAQIAKLNREIAESRAARDADRATEFHVDRSNADTLYEITHPDEKKTRTSRARSSGKSDAQRAAEEVQARERELTSARAQLELEQQLAELRAQGTDAAKMQADIMESNAQLAARYPKMAESDLKDLQAMAEVTIRFTYDQKAAADDLDKFFDELDRKQKKAADKRQTAADDLARRQNAQIRTLADLYTDAFKGGTSAIWRDFKDIGIRVIAETLARFTLSRLSGGSGGIGDFIGSAVHSVLGFASGTASAPAGVALVGERGPELVRFSGGERVIPNHELGSALAPGGSQQVTVVVQANDYFDARVAGISRTVATPIATSAAAQASSAMGQAVIKGVPRRMVQFNRDGT